ncbi:kinase-like domain-containing protein [Suillus placidus]|uniref:Kinase-like domain-containing protein n=1 Tax=Suillus placidus TaxID=48579 RepID=A0A9P6ZJP8_9AGAM|nr:kinase-like domain-containing protein [Suillus placidus]
MVSSPLFYFPFLVCEVISQKKEEDRYRMLLQAITAARAGQFLMVDGAPKPFFVVAIYLCANLTAERYVVTHTTPTEEGEEGQEDRQVSIAQKDFDLTTAGGAVTFLREMYNLVAMLEDLAKHLDKGKQGSLVKVHQDASKIISLTSKAKQGGTGGSTLASMVEDAADEEPQDDLGVFGTEAIQAILKKMNYKINFIPAGYPLIASVSNATSTHESEKGYLKFVKEGGKEIEILQYLTGIDSPANHTISGVRIWPVRGGNVISMPVAGGWLTSLTNPSAHLWSVAKQLFEAVDFMHQHGVAHMDLKPNNILIPVNGGRLTVIDFNRSLRVKGVEHRFRGVVGTPEYIAPEVAVGNGLYSAIRADLWSCGKTLEELCDKCRPSTDRNTLLEISWQLMDKDPKKRPMMTEVLDRLTRCAVDATTRPGSSSFNSVAPQEVQA